MKISHTKIVSLGGTASSTKHDANINTRYSPSKNSEDLLQRLTQFYKNLTSYCQLSTYNLLKIDSKDTSLSNIHKIEAKLAKIAKQDDVDNIVVICGTDNMVSICFAMHLSQKLYNIGKPIVFTGAMRTFDAEEPDVFSNINQAVIFANQLQNSMLYYNKNSSSIYLSFNYQLIEAVNIRKKHSQNLNTFDNHLAVATIDDLNNINFYPLHTKTQSMTPKIYSRFEFPQKVQNFAPSYIIKNQINFPQFMQKSIIKDIKDNKTKAIVIECTGNGTYQQNTMQPIIDMANRNNIAVVRTSTCEGDVDYVDGETTIASRGLSSEQSLMLLRIALAQTEESSITEPLDLQSLFNQYA